MILTRTDGEFFENRIPGIISTRHGTLIAYYEARRSNSDWADIDICVLRSENCGSSWERVLQIPGGGNTLNNPVMIDDGDTVHFLYCKNYRELYYRKSCDDGKSFTPKRRVHFDAPVPYTVFAVGPGHGITHGGELLVPIWFAYDINDPKAHKPSQIAVLHSPNGGNSWLAGDVISCELPNPSECALATDGCGRVLISIRNEDKAHLRALSVSDNGYSGWALPTLCHSLPDPICQGSMLSTGGYVMHLNCTSQTAREDLVLKLSRDGFDTYKDVYISRNGGYADLCAVGGKVCVFYEVRDKMTKTMDLHFTAVPLAELTE